jgi:DNA-binding CsgD family transcriptional regulator
VIVGAAGTGKSRLALESAAEAEAAGWATVVLGGSGALSSVPCGPFRAVVPAPPASSDGMAQVAGSIEHALFAMRSAKGLVLVVDDAHLLDEASAALVHQHAAAGSSAVLVTARAGLPLPPTITALWLDDLADRIRLANLSRNETAALLAGALGAELRDSSVDRLWRVTDGNPLYLREVVLSSFETGALREDGGQWSWDGTWASGVHLQEVVAERLGRLDADEQRAIQALALAGPLPYGIVAELATEKALGALESRGLVTSSVSGRRLDVAISHPLHAEVIRDRTSLAVQWVVRRDVAEALEARGSRRVADRLRLAGWSFEGGVEVDWATLELVEQAETVAFSGIGEAVSAKLREVFPDAPDAPAPVPQGVLPDPEVGVELAEAAYRSGGLAEGFELAGALVRWGSTERAEAVLAELAGAVETDEQRVRLALHSARYRWSRLRDVAGARALLTEALDLAAGAGGQCDETLRGEVLEWLAVMAWDESRPAEALDYAQRAAEATGRDLAEGPLATAAISALCYLGRCDEALDLDDRDLRAACARGNGLGVVDALLLRVLVLEARGDLVEARALAEWLREVALECGQHDLTAHAGISVGEMLLRQGLPEQACRLYRDAVALLAERDLFGLRSWALAGVARSYAALGDPVAARKALEAAREEQPPGRPLEWFHHLAAVEVARAEGRGDEAARAAAEGVGWARESGMLVAEAWVLDAWLRADPSEGLSDRLQELAEATDSRYVHVLAAYSRAVVTADAPALLEASDGLAALTAWPAAAEAAVASAVHHERQGRSAAALAAAQRASELAARCEGAVASLPRALHNAALLTRREQEVALFAAGGMSSREIAERLAISRRTVDNLLQRAYAKLGVSDRSALATVMSIEGRTGLDLPGPGGRPARPDRR